MQYFFVEHCTKFHIVKKIVTLTSSNKHFNNLICDNIFVMKLYNIFNKPLFLC